MNNENENDELTLEQQKEVLKSKSVENIIKTLKRYGKDISEREAQHIFSLLQQHELSDDELSNVSGGLFFVYKGGTPKLQVGQSVYVMSEGAYGTISKVSSKPEGLVLKEWKYTVQINNKTDEYYESEIK